VGGGDLRLLFDPESLERARRLGHRPEEGRAHHGVRLLGALLYRAFEREAPALAAGIAYAATDELHQHFVRGRHAAPVDVAIDAVGVALGMLIWLRVRER
jgi:hypothetical protein